MLSSSSKYALRTVSVLAEHEGTGPMTARDIATRARVPMPYLFKMLGRLREAGVVEVLRGARGGYRLARPGKRVRLASIVGLFEDIEAPTGCVLGVSGVCGGRSPCALHDQWRGVRTAYLAFLAKTSIADIARPHAAGSSSSRPSRRRRR